MNKANMRFYIVGGAVRDALLGKEPHDYDIVVEGSTPEQMKELGFIQVGKSFPVFLHPVTKMEFALCRKEIKTGDKHTDFDFIWNKVMLYEDLERRDFTINAMASKCRINIETGEITPLGLDPETLEPVKLIDQAYVIDKYDGLQDLKNKIIKHVNAKHFIEDPLRVLRACRFAAQLDFDIHPSTMKLLQKMVKNGMLKHLSRQRIDNEMLKAMSSGFNSEKFILLMKECGALQELYPELEALFNNNEQIKYHSTGNTGLHVMAALRYAKNYEPHVKMAVLYHDVYKPIAYRERQTTDQYVPHDSEDALKYFDNVTKKYEYSYKVRQSIKSAIKYHMIMWKLFDGIAVKKYIDLIGNITREFDESYGYALYDLLEVCAADDMSDKTDYSRQHGQSDKRSERLLVTCIDIFNICRQIKYKDVPNYQELDYTKVKDKQRIMRIEAVQKHFNISKDFLLKNT